MIMREVEIVLSVDEADRLREILVGLPQCAKGGTWADILETVTAALHAARGDG